MRGKPPAPPKPLVLGYYASWNTGLLPRDIRYGYFTHLTHAFVRADRQTGALLDNPAIPLPELAERAHAAGTKVLFAVGGASSGGYLNPLMGEAGKRKALIDSTLAALAKSGYDGIDLDWEFPETPADAANLALLVSELDAALRQQSEKLLLTMAIPALDYNGKHFDGHLLAAHVDFVNVMTYDMHGPWSRHSGHNAPLAAVAADRDDGRAANCEAAISGRELKQNWPRDRVNLGIPLYGRGFPAEGFHQPFTGPGSYPEISYKKVRDLLADGWERHWEADGKVPWLSKPGSGHVISYDDEESVEAKGRWAKGARLAGIFFWEISQDWIEGDHILVRAARKGLGMGG